MAYSRPACLERLLPAYLLLWADTTDRQDPHLHTPIPHGPIPAGPRKVAPGKVRRKRGSRGMAELVALQQ